jgi:hypothetical protein
MLEMISNAFPDFILILKHFRILCLVVQLMQRKLPSPSCPSTPHSPADAIGSHVTSQRDNRQHLRANTCAAFTSS